MCSQTLRPVFTIPTIVRMTGFRRFVAERTFPFETVGKTGTTGNEGGVVAMQKFTHVPLHTHVVAEPMVAHCRFFLHVRVKHSPFPFHRLQGTFKAKTDLRKLRLIVHRYNPISFFRYIRRETVTSHVPMSKRTLVTAPPGKILVNIGTVKTAHAALASTYDALPQERTRLRPIENSYGAQVPTGACLQHDSTAVADLFLSEGLDEVYQKHCGGGGAQGVRHTE